MHHRLSRKTEADIYEILHMVSIIYKSNRNTFQHNDMKDSVHYTQLY